MAVPSWPPREDSVADKHGEKHKLVIAPYNNLEPPADDSRRGPWDAFGLHAEVSHPHGSINVWLVCTESQLGFLADDAGPDAEETTLLDTKEQEARCGAVSEDFTVKVKLAFRSGQLLPGDEIHVRLGPELRVPPYGELWRRALSED